MVRSQGRPSGSEGDHGSSAAVLAVPVGAAWPSGAQPRLASTTRRFLLCAALLFGLWILSTALADQARAADYARTPAAHVGAETAGDTTSPPPPSSHSTHGPSS